MKMTDKFKIIFLFILLFSAINLPGQDKTNQNYRLPGFQNSLYFDEQIKTINYEYGITITINAPPPKLFNPDMPVSIALYALPNGNTTSQTIGKVFKDGDDWHYDIQHIGAQTRFIREHIDEYNLVTVYLENDLLSWPAWKRANKNHASVISGIVDSLRNVFSGFTTNIILTGHSGGGRFIFSYLDAVNTIPSYVKRVSFLDSNYGYNDDYGNKLIEWLNKSDDTYLTVFAYNDSVALYNGERFVSDTGGTWYRSKMMQQFLAGYYNFSSSEDTAFISYSALEERIKILLKKNPQRKILHTVQVERNGFIHSMLSETKHEEINYDYYGERAYVKYVQKNFIELGHLSIPPRPADAISGSQFMRSIKDLPFEAREKRILKEISQGNIPEFLRTLRKITSEFYDAESNKHTVEYEVMPDYLSIGSDRDYCRIPMSPITAQKVADLFGASLPTRKLVNDIYRNADIKIPPKTYYPKGNQNELVSRFVMHNNAIEHQLDSTGAPMGKLVAGHKKDVVISNKLNDPNRPEHVTIYGWHKPDGEPIQPLTNIHVNWYVDYSHGIRLINKHLSVDGEAKTIQEVLKDGKLYSLLSDEKGAMVRVTYN